MGFFMLNDLVLNSYIAGVTSLRDVADKCDTDHHTVKRILIKNGITPIRAKRKPFTEEHRRKISESSKGRTSWIKGKKATKKMLYKNMASHLRFDVEYQWLMQFDDIEKLKTLNDCISKRADRFNVDTDWYKSYICKFYSCDRFNKIYESWVKSGKDNLKKPSIDHINPKSNGGCNSLDNLQFLTWFENRCKNNMNQVEWDQLKSKIHEYLI